MNIFAAVSNKSVLDPLLAVVDRKSVKFWGTEGTVQYLKAKGFEAQSVVSGFDFDGRLKSIDKKVFARVLADGSNKKHLDELQRMFSLSHSRPDRESDIRPEDSVSRDPRFREDDGRPFDLVIVDLYPLDKKNFPESMDIGGQALIRAAIKNYKGVALAFDKSSLASLVVELISNKGSTTLNFRKTQAQKAARFIAERSKEESSSF